jgi:methylphosphotriester-DNA--protein-cysteine methyltransferase
MRWIAQGKYVKHRVFFADEATAISAGFRPCRRCLPKRHSLWKDDQAAWRETASAARATN